MKRLLVGFGLLFGIATIGASPAAAQTVDTARAETIIASPVPFSVQTLQGRCAIRDPMPTLPLPNPPSAPMPNVRGDAGTPAVAQEVGVRFGAGPAVAGSLDGGALLGVHLNSGSFMARADGQFVGTGRSADWQRSTRVASLGLSAGLAQRRAAGSTRGYALLGGSVGLDPRESDKTWSVGAVVGLERTSRIGFFGELRAERWFQHGPVHHDLPGNLLTAVFGVVIR